MFARGLCVVAFSGLCLASMPALAAQPVGEWKIEPSEARCVAVRQYGLPSKPMTLALKASLHGDAIQLAVLRDGYQRHLAQTGVTIAVDGARFETTAISYPISGNRRRVAHLINLDADASAAIRNGSNLQVSVIEGFEESFKLASPIDAWKNLQDCVSRVRETWNIGEEWRVRIDTAARGDLRPLFSSDDYPLRAMLADQSGSTKIGLLIDEQGRVRDCTLIEASGIAMLDARSCGIIVERARFEPAVGADGKPVKSSWRQTITWRLAG